MVYANFNSNFKFTARKNIDIVFSARWASSAILLGLMLIVFINALEAATITWNGGGGATDYNWSTPANWAGGVPPANGDAVVFDSTSVKNSIVDASFTATIASLSMNSGYTGSVTLANNINISGNFRLAQGTFDASSFNVSLSGDLDATGSLTRSLKFGSGNWTISGSRFDTSAVPRNSITFTASAGLVDFTSSTTINTGLWGLQNLFKDVNLAYSGKTITLEATGSRMDVGANGQIRLKGGTITGTGTRPTLLLNQADTADIIFDSPTTLSSPLVIGYHTVTLTPWQISGHNFGGVAGIEFFNCDGDGGASILLGNDLTATSATININKSSGYVSSPNMMVKFNNKNVTVKDIEFVGEETSAIYMGNGTVTLSGGLGITSSGINHELYLEGATVYVGGNWRTVSGADTITVYPGSSNVILNGTGSQTITSNGQSFNNLTITNASTDGVTFADALTTATITDTTNGSKLKFAGAGTHTVTSTLTLTGGTGSNMITLAPATAATNWNFSPPASTTVTGVDVSYSQSNKTITASNSNNGGYNSNWVFEILSLTLRNAGDSADYTTWSLGTGKTVNTEYIMGSGEAVFVKNDGDITEDFSIKASGASWMLGSTTAENQAVLMGLFNSNTVPLAADYNVTYDVITGSIVWATQSSGDGKFEGVNDGDSVAAGAGQKLYIYLKTPSSITNGNQETITVTIGARKH